MAWSGEGDKLASGSADGSIKIWFMDKIASLIGSAASSSRISESVSLELSTGSQNNRNVNQLQWSPLNSSILASCSSDKCVKIWSVSSKGHSNILSIPVEIEILTLCWHPLKRILTVGSKDDQIFFYEFDSDFSKSNLIESLKLSCDINDISWSADGKDLAVALGNANCDIFRIKEDKTVERIKSLKAHTADCSDLLALGSSDAQITLWRNYGCFRVLNRMEWPIRCIDFSHDGQFLAVGSEDPFIAIEHVNSPTLIAKVPTTTANSKSITSSGVPVNSVTWHPNKHILAFATSEVDDRTGKATGTIKLFGLC